MLKSQQEIINEFKYYDFNAAFSEHELSQIHKVMEIYKDQYKDEAAMLDWRFRKWIGDNYLKLFEDFKKEAC